MKYLYRLIFVMLACVSCGKSDNPDYPTSGNWDTTVSRAINDFIRVCNEEPGKEYVVFDFDNTCSIFDISEQLLTYQIETMSFELDAKEFRNAIFDGLKNYDSKIPLEVISRLTNIADNYSVLYEQYGPFSYRGISADLQALISKDELWLEFALDLASLYYDMEELTDTKTSYAWMYCLYSGMTEQELYELSVRSHERFSQIPTTAREWQLGDKKFSWLDGIQVTEEIRALWKSLHDNGIDVWVCSASCIRPVMAAVDYFGLHDYCTGIIAFSYKKDFSGRLTPYYDFDNGCGVLALKDGTWKEDNLPFRSMLWREGKVTGIQNSIAPKYLGEGPSAGFGDSTGDFSFCTEFNSLKMVIFFNRATRKVTEGGGLIAELAIYQRDCLGYDLAKANAQGDTFYLLQGRDENGFRTFRKSSSTVRFGSSSEILFCNQDNYTQYEYFKANGLSTKEILNTFSIKTAAEDNPLGFDYGFLEEYSGYHSIK